MRGGVSRGREVLAGEFRFVRCVWRISFVVFRVVFIRGLGFLEGGCRLGKEVLRVRGRG